MKRLLLFIWRSLYLFGELLILGLILLAFYLGFAINIRIPQIEDMSALDLERQEVGEKQYRIGNSWANFNEYGIWEVYVEGSPFERGAIYGKLLEEPVQQQETFFVDQIEKIVPNSFYRFFLKVLIGYFNRDMDDYIPMEYQEEIYGVSFSFSDLYDNVGPKYYRILNYHAAHDIGHALKDYNMVGCTSFSLKNDMSADSALLVARNFDFYVGDEFSEEKVLSFFNPTDGYKFAMYSWAGFMGVASGMNEHGLCVTINASKSELPTKTKTPISILTREILQYAKTVEEAIEIAKKREVFVSETIMVTSAIDNKTILIEKAPEALDVYETKDNKVLCTNHYQSEHFVNQDINLQNIERSDSKYRYNRLNQLLPPHQLLDVSGAVEVLRNQKGLDDIDLGMGNPKAINQLIAHHSVVFRPQEKKMWVSTGAYQINEFICYDLDEVFKKAAIRDLNEPLYFDSLTIPASPFASSEAYEKFKFYKEIKQKLFDSYMLGIKFDLSEEERDQFIASNPNSYVTYMTLGQYYLALEKCQEANKYFEESLKHEVASLDEEEKIKQLMDECNQ